MLRLICDNFPDIYAIAPDALNLCMHPVSNKYQSCVEYAWKINVTNSEVLYIATVNMLYILPDS